MLSNTKLTRAQKSELRNEKDWFNAHEGELHYFPQYGVTFAIRPVILGGNSKFSLLKVAYATPQEKKFRKKVGAWHALCNGVDALTIPTPRDANHVAALAAMLSVYTYDRNVYDRDVYDRDGFDVYGYDRDGYDRDGYDQDGYDRDGYDSNGYDLDGYDSNGYDQEGYLR